MTFRTVDHELVRTCKEQVDCLHCPMRIGCYLRYSFYFVDSYEAFSSVVLKSSLPFQGKLPSGELKKFDTMLKHKWVVERLNNPNGYQYNG